MGPDNLRSYHAHYDVTAMILEMFDPGFTADDITFHLLYTSCYIIVYVMICIHSAKCLGGSE